jgi:hypothetical protein
MSREGVEAVSGVQSALAANGQVPAELKRAPGSQRRNSNPSLTQ